MNRQQLQYLEVGARVLTTTMNVSHTFEHSTFLQSASGKGIAGACAWAAILVTCHQIYEYLR